MAEKKKRENVVEKFFSKKKVLNDAGKELSVTWCLLCGDAGKPFKCVTTYNLLRHLLLKHKKEAADAGVVCNEENEEVIDGDVPVKPSRVHIVLDRNLYISSIVRWITDGSVSLNFFSKKYVSDVLGAIEVGLKLRQTSRKNIVPYISAVEARMVNFITHQMQGKYICVKADLASRKGRAVLSINSQYVLRGKIVVRTLAMVERIDKNTAENIYADIEKVLNKFGVDLKQVYSITTDNGKNFLKAANIMRRAQQEELNSSEMDCEGVENGTSEDEDEGFLPAEEQPSISEDDAPEDISDDSEYLNFSNDQNSSFEDIPEDDLPVIDQPHLTGVKCAAHVIQLSVYDVIKKKPVAKFLAKVRKLVKILKTQPYATHYKLDKTRNVPILDGETRWGSAHRMVARMCDQKEFVQGLLPADLQREFNEKFWASVDRFVKATFPLYLLTKRIQQESLTCGEMFLYWKECCLELTAMNDSLGNQLLAALENRKHMWFDNPAFLAALFVDPRLNCFEPPLLSQDQKEIAIRHLMTTWKSYRSVVKENVNAEDNNVPSTSTTSETLPRVEKLLSMNRQQKPPEVGDIENRIRKIPLEMYAPLETDVIKWWEAKMSEDKELAELSILVSQLPCTQVSVERTFNGLGLVLTKTRMRLGAPTLETILFVKANDEIFDEVYFQYDF